MFARTVVVKGNLEVELWSMVTEDAPFLLEFYRSLAMEDLLYLREEVTSPESMDRWIESIDSEQSLHLLAGYQGRIVADGELDYPFYGWSRHVGEIRLVVDPAFRGSGLSQLMVQELLIQAAEEGLHKVIVQMTVDQHTAIHLFQRLGFRQEAILPDHVQDQQGRFRDLILMSYFTHDLIGYNGTDRLANQHDRQ